MSAVWRVVRDYGVIAAVCGAGMACAGLALLASGAR